MKRSNRTAYALEALFFLAAIRPKEAATSKEIAGYCQIPESYLVQILFLLRRAGLLAAVRGAKGGFLLAREPGEISVWEIVRILEGGIHFAPCVHSLSLCRSRVRSRCTTRALWSKLSDCAEQTLGGITLDTLCVQYARERKKGEGK